MFSNSFKLKYAVVGALQGLAFVLLYIVEPVSQWPLAIEYTLYFVSVFLSLSILLLFRDRPDRYQLLQVLIASLWLGLISVWVFLQGFSASEFQRYDDGMMFAWTLLAVLLTYILLPFIQSSSLFRLRSADYAALYRHSWDNFFVVLLAGIFMLIYWLMVLLCSALFEMLGLHIVEDLLINAYFLFFTMPIMFALGIAIGHEHEKVISTLRFIALSVCRYLLPLSMLISLVFAITLLFTGLESMWSTRFSTHALLWLIVVNLVFMNGLYQDGANTVKYPLVLKLLGNLTLFALLAFAVIAVYSVYVRIEQYGLTPNRVYMIVITIVAVMYTVSYAWAAIRSLQAKIRNNWLDEIKTPNVTIAYLVAILIVLLHTPYLDVYSISTRSQLKRLQDPATDISKFDFGVFKYHLGQPGQRVLAQLELGELSFAADRQQLIKERLAVLNKCANYYEWQARLRSGRDAELEQMLRSFDAGKPVPEELPTEFEQYYCTYEPCKVLFVDLTRDGKDEALVVQKNNYNESRIYVQQTDNSWKHMADLEHRGVNLFEKISTGKYVVSEPGYKTLRLDDKELGIVPR